MKRKIKYIIFMLLMLVGCCSLTGCLAEEQVQHNIMQDIGNFKKIYRKE